MAKFEPGSSGNPGGRPKTKELREVLRGFSDKATERLIELIDHKDGRVALLAVKEFFDRLHGKALQASELTIEDNRTSLGEPRALTPMEVAVSLKELLTESEKEMGLQPMPLGSNKERIDRILREEKPLPPSLYAALHRAEGTRH